MEEKGNESRVVIADDVRGSRELLREWLSKSNVELVVTQDGNEAFDAIQKCLPDLVITDIQMPRMNGIDLLSAIRQSERCEIRKLPVIVITSLMDQEIADVIENFGGTTVMLKPLHKAVATSVVRRILSGQIVDRIYCGAGATEGAVAGPAISPTLRRLVRQARQ